MRLHAFSLLVAASAAALLAGCAPKPVDFDLEVRTILDGRPVKDAEVVVDGVVEGKTDEHGYFAKSFARIPDQTVRLSVRKEAGKFRAKVWEKSFAVKHRKSDEPKEKQSFVAELQRYVVIAARRDGAPEGGAQVSVEGKTAGTTADNGEVEYVFDKWPHAGLHISVKKAGFGETDLVYRGESGDRIEVPLYTEAIVTVEALEDRNGIMRPIKGAVVAVAGREVGRTGENGTYVYRHKGKLGGTVPVRISAAGYLPSTFTRTVALGGSRKVQQYFYSATAERPRVAVLGFASNTRGEDIGDVVKKIETAFVQELFDQKAFRQVPTATARNLIQRSKLSQEKLRSKGWRGTPLADAADVLVFGSVSRGPDDSFVVEASFYDVNGKLIITEAAVAGSSGSWRVGRAVSEIVSNVIASYPVTGVVTSADDENIQMNVGRNQFSLDSDDIFVVQSVRRDEDGRIVGATETGTVKLRRQRDDYSELRPEALRGTVRPGDRVVRIDVSARAEGTERVVFALTGGKTGTENALGGANVYIDQRWVGTTDRKGELAVPLRLGTKYKLIIYRHGYEQVTQNIEPSKKNERIAFALKWFTSDFTVESEPSGAAVTLDDARIGTTPITKPYPVTLGFHTVRVDAGGDYRAWEEVIEFSRLEENRTGANRIVLYKDYLKLADRAEQAKQFDEAIRLYTAAPREHPDYAELRNRLGQLYFDEKHDIDRAITEFERVTAIPEIHDLIYKQFAVVYTNLGKAYYVKGESLIRSSKNDAMQYFAKAIKALDVARENTRFFPVERHDEAVHDTYYYRALAYNSLYQLTRREALLPSVENAWNEYLDFFPDKLRGRPEFEQMREAGEKLAKQVQSQQ